MSAPQPFDAGVARQIGSYADAVRVPAGYDQILVSGTPGLAADGSLPGDITQQSTLAWQNVDTILQRAGARLADIVGIRQWLIRAEDIGAYVDVRSKFISHQAASMLAVVPALVRPGFLVEIEVVAAVPAGKAGS